MPYSTCTFIKRVAEFVPAQLWKNIPDNTRGIYALLNRIGRGRKERFDVVYVGMSGGKETGMWSRFKFHRRKEGLKWSHFTVFEVHDNITAQEIRELEGLLRHLYRKDSQANRNNKQLCHKPFLKVAVPKRSLRKWSWPE